MEGMYAGSQGTAIATLDEPALLAGLRNGDAASYESLVRTWCGRMLAVARRILGNEEDAKDCVQDSFLQAFRKIDAFEGRSSLGTWLHRIVVNTALMKMRSRERNLVELLEELLPRFDATGHRVGRQICPRASAEELASRAEIRSLVQEKIAALPERYRLALVLRDIEGYDTNEAAELLGISVATMKVRLHRARAALKIQLEPYLKEHFS